MIGAFSYRVSERGEREKETIVIGAFSDRVSERERERERERQ